MDYEFWMVILIKVSCYLLSGIILGFQIVHHIEEKLRKVNFSYIRYIFTVLIVFILTIASRYADNIIGYSPNIGFLLMIIGIVSAVVTVLYFLQFKNKKDRYAQSENSVD